MKKIAFILVMIVSATPFAQDIHTKKGYAAEGYDVVAYFSNQALEGDTMNTTTYGGVKYKFATAENIKTFIANPEKYTPQYGGYCAYAVADSGKRVQIDPESFQIKDGKLYLFYDAFFSHTLKKWNEEGADMMQIKADENWEKMQLEKN
ncbi:YHS domain-containing (seleno)protein [Rasiella sp. SM2506]|uniref:YHS domain-containing (seleno)protein n=1 Tax=Rasiella sp. SM2506 TaxID=3423914 RepID=UPI003D79B124